jgi:hypothetical protein
MAVSRSRRRAWQPLHAVQVVTIHWPSHVRAVFGEAHQPKAHRPGPHSMGSAVKAAFGSEFPDGPPEGMPMGEVLKRVAAKMKGSGIPVSDKTLRRHGITKDKIRRKS